MYFIDPGVYEDSENLDTEESGRIYFHDSMEYHLCGGVQDWLKRVIIEI
jgi:hypothetical protein